MAAISLEQMICPEVICNALFQVHVLSGLSEQGQGRIRDRDLSVLNVSRIAFAASLVTGIVVMVVRNGIRCLAPRY